MAVYKRNYRPYSGDITNPFWRFLVVTRYAMAEVFAMRFFGAVFCVCFFPVVIALSYVYVANSEIARTMLNMGPSNILRVDSLFFIILLRVQGFLAFALCCWAGPGLLTADLANNGLPLFFSRSISRWEYVLGKMTAMLLLLSAITWVPGMIVFLMQVSLDSTGWFDQNGWIITSFTIGSLVWIVLLSLLALAISAIVKWRVVASLSMVMLFFVPAGMGEIFNAVTRSGWGRLLNMSYLTTVIWSDLFHDVLNLRANVVRGVRVLSGARRVAASSVPQIPVEIAWLAIIIICGLCLLVLHQRLRAREVVRG